MSLLFVVEYTIYICTPECFYFYFIISTIVCIRESEHQLFYCCCFKICLYSNHNNKRQNEKFPSHVQTHKSLVMFLRNCCSCYPGKEDESLHKIRMVEKMKAMRMGERDATL